jgi:hypothetical protein
MQTAALDSMSDNGFSNSTLNLQCGNTTGSGVTVTLNNGPCEIPTDPNFGQPVYAEVILAESEPTFFARIFHIQSEEITARAEAKSVPYCMIFSADDTSSSAPPGVQFNLVSLGANISADCGLADDSGATDAMTTDLVSLFTSVDTEQTVDHGGISTGLLSSISFSPAPQTYAPVVPDPLSYLTPPTQPSPGSCNYGGLLGITILAGADESPGTYCGPVLIAPVVGKVTFEPGTYYFENGVTIAGVGDVAFGSGSYDFNGGLNIAGAGNVTFGSGTYYIDNGMSITGAADVSGTGVTFYLDSGSVHLTGLVPTQLYAPTTGDYAGILFFQNRTDTTPMTLIGDTGSVFQGAVYAVDAPLTVLGVNDAAYTIIDTGSLNEYLDIGLVDSLLSILNGETFHVGADYSSLPYGSPIKVGSSILVE